MFPGPGRYDDDRSIQGSLSRQALFFGHPACPRLEDQRTLFDILRPEEIGVQLTDGYMMDPEASVSAIVFHHPEASYFSVDHGSAIASGI